MWHLFWDTVGFIADTVKRPVKIVLFALLLLIVFFFFGLNASFYFAGLLFWIAVLFFVIANIVVRIRRARTQAKTAAVAPLTSDDQADIAEFQEAMQRQPSVQPTTPSVRKAAPPPNLPSA
ncbi:MAG: hypothetical protein U0517_03280 [Candidatus Andersenbacteria bacterium]